MGRILDLCGEVAAEAEEGEEGMVLPPDAWERLHDDWTEEEIEDALKIVRESLWQSELVDAADSLSVRLLELLGAFGGAEGFQKVEKGAAVLSIEEIGQLARRVARVEEVLDAFREGPGPDRRGFEALRRRLADYGIEEEMEADLAAEALRRRPEGDDLEEDEEE